MTPAQALALWQAGAMSSTEAITFLLERAAGEAAPQGPAPRDDGQCNSRRKGMRGVRCIRPEGHPTGDILGGTASHQSRGGWYW